MALEVECREAREQRESRGKARVRRNGANERHERRGRAVEAHQASKSLHVWCPRQNVVKQLLANDEGARGDEGG